MKKQKFALLAVGGCLVLQVVAMTLMCAYYVSGGLFAYPEPIEWLRLVREIPQIGSESIAQGTTVIDWLMLEMMGGGLALTLSSTFRNRSVIHDVFFLLQPIVFFGYWIGFLLIGELAVDLLNLDGEWLAEHSPTAIVGALWMVVSVAVVVWRRRIGRSQSAIVAASSGS